MKRALLILAIFSGSVFAQATRVGSDIVGAPGSPPKASANARINKLDTNKDGQLDRVELTGYAVKQFLDMDLNKDRFLSEDEFDRADRASRIVKAESLKDFCRNAILEKADELLLKKERSNYKGLQPVPSTKVAETPPKQP